MTINEIAFDKEKLHALKMECGKANADGKESFLFEGNEYLVSYAKYLISYLEGVLEK